MSANIDAPLSTAVESLADSPPAVRDDTSTEKARASVSLAPQRQIDRYSSDNILTGGQTYRYDFWWRKYRDVKMAITQTVSAALWSPPDIVATNDYTENPEFEALDKFIVDLITRDLDALQYQDLGGVLFDTLTTARVCGYSVAEPVFERVGTRPRVLRAIKTKPSWNFEPIVDNYDNLIKLRHTPTGEEFDIEDFAYGVWPYIHAGSHLGISDLEAIACDLERLDAITQSILGNADRNANKVVLHYYNALDRSKEESARVNGEVAGAFNGTNNAVLHIPASEDVDKKFNKQDEFDILEQRGNDEMLTQLAAQEAELKKEIKRYLGLPDDLGSTTAPNGSWAKAKEEMNMFVLQAAKGQDWIAGWMNSEILPKMVSAEFPNLPESYSCPEFVFPEVEEKFANDTADFVGKVRGMGLYSPDDKAANEWMRTLLKGPPPSAQIAPPTEEVE